MTIPAGAGFSVLGDSISTLGGYIPDGWRVHYEGEVHIDGVCTPSDTWWGKVIEHFGGHLVGNASFSGSVVEGFGFPAAISPQRTAALLGPNGEQPDVVLFFMGINDYGWGGGRNQVMGGSLSASAKPEDLPGDKVVTELAEPNALDRFANAYARTIVQIHKVAPQAQIWCLTLCPGTIPGEDWPNFAWSYRGIELDDYSDSIRIMAGRTGANVADVRAYGIDIDAVDGVHPSALGMTQIASIVINEMEGGLRDRALIPSLEGAAESQRACYESSCSGCPYRTLLPMGWSLQCNKFAPAE